MKQIWILFRQEMKILAYDRQALALLFVMPLALITFLTFALQDIYLDKVGRHREIHVITSQDCDSEKTECGVLVSRLKQFNYQVVLSKELDPAKKMDLALILPQDVEKTIGLLKEKKSLEPADQVQVLFNPLMDQSARALVAGHVTMALQGILIEQLNKEFKKAEFKMQVTDVGAFDGLVIQKAFGNVVLPNPIQQTVPAWTLFGMFFILIPMTNSMIRDRKSGVFKRLLSFPVSKWHLIVGKILPFLVINVLQFFIMFMVGIFILPKMTHLDLNLDFDWAGIFVVTLASALAATSYGLLVSCFAKTSEQAHAFGAFSIVILAIVGGVMIPRFVMPEFMQQASLISPLYWGLDAYLDLIVRKLPLASIWPKVFLLIGFSFVAALISGLRFRWTEEN